MKRTFDELIKAHILNTIPRMFTALPGRVVSEPRLLENQPVIDVQPLINSEEEDGTAQESGVIDEVPIAFPAGGRSIITMPIDVGDTVLLIFCMRSIEEFLASDGSQPTTPFSKRKHAQADAVAIPGLFTNINHLGFSSTDVVVKHNTGEDVENRLELQKNGHIVIQSSNRIELGEGATEALVLGNAFLDFFNNHIHQTGVGPSSIPTIPMTEPEHLSNLSFTRRV